MRLRILLIIDLALLAVLGLGIYRASERAAFPLPLETRVTGEGRSAPFLTHSDIFLRSINDVPITSAAEAEFYVSNYNIGEAITTTYSDGSSQQLTLVPYYGRVYTVIQSLTALVFALLGLLILLLKPGDLLARKFHHLAFALAALIAHTTGSFTIPTPTISVVLETLFHTAYAISGVLFLQFILTFTRYSAPKRKYLERSLFLIALALATIASFYFAKTHGPADALRAFESYDTWLKLIRIFFGVLFISGIGILIRAVRTTRDPSLNRQLSWVLYGCTISILAYILLWQIPIIFNAKDIISEETMLLLSIIAPISIAIGIVRHKLFDIDLLIKKSISYALLVAVIIGVYIVAVTGATWLAQQFNSKNTIYPAAVAAILAALLFDPLRRKVSTLVDQKFFRSSYDFRQAQRQFLEDIKEALDLQTLGSFVVERIQQLIPVERIGFFVLTEDARRMRLVAHEGFGVLDRHSLHFTPEALRTSLAHPVALPEFVEEAVIEIGDRLMFERWKIAFVVPMLGEAHHPLGFIVLGRRRSETRFTADDVELLSQVASQSAIVLERLLIQQKLLMEQAESQRLDELNRLKSYFVSSVTHDLKTPLTSIRLYAELLHGHLPEEKRLSYLATIEGETQRLARLITNVLDFARIEQGTKAYMMRAVDLTGTIRDAVELLRHQIEADGFALTLQIPQHPLTINADRDAITGAIINLLSNALKYSGDKKCIAVSLTTDNVSAELNIADKGIGMEEDVVRHIFEPFYRASQHSGSGAGLGLSIVKHTVDAHNAAIKIVSAPANGTTFTITFPLI